MSPSIALMIRAVLVPLAVVALLLGGARADKVDRLSRQLTSAKDDKVRLSAALSLSKLGDERAIPALLEALGDKNRSVRGVSAAALAKVVGASTSKKVRRRVLAALERSGTRDRDAFVRKQAKKAYTSISRARETAPARSAAGGTYVHIGAMSAETDGGAAMRKLMQKTAAKTFAKRAGDMTTEWPGGAPSRRELSARNVNAFHVDGTLNRLDVRTSGGTATVSCQVSMLLATYPEKSMFGFLKGGAQVQSGTSDRDVRYAREDCVAAVVEDLIARKIIPTIEARTR